MRSSSWCRRVTCITAPGLGCHPFLRLRRGVLEYALVLPYEPFVTCKPTRQLGCQCHGDGAMGITDACTCDSGRGYFLYAPKLGHKPGETASFPGTATFGCLVDGGRVAEVSNKVPPSRRRVTS